MKNRIISLEKKKEKMSLEPNQRSINNKTQTNYNRLVQQGRVFISKLTEGELATSFDVLNERTPVALQSFIAFECNENNKSFKTAEAIRSAFKQYFHDKFHCQGDCWRKDSDNQWIGNPVYDQQFTSFMDNLRSGYESFRSSSPSVPMTYYDLSVIMKHLQDPKYIDQYDTSVNLLFQAFAATAFTLWARYVIHTLRLQFFNFAIDN